MSDAESQTMPKVLVVEDEEYERTGLAELLTAWGYRVETAADGINGFLTFLAWAPTVVITGLRLPRMDGLELVQRLATCELRPPVVVLTSRGAVEEAVAAMKVGAFDFLEKPIAPPRLRQIIDNAVRSKSVRAHTRSAENVISFEVGRTTVEEAEKELIIRTVELIGNKTHAAQILGISLKTLHNKLNEYSVSAPRVAG